jgi:hypothetical protein
MSRDTRRNLIHNYPQDVQERPIYAVYSLENVNFLPIVNFSAKSVSSPKKAVAKISENNDIIYVFFQTR